MFKIRLAGHGCGKHVASGAWRFPQPAGDRNRHPSQTGKRHVENAVLWKSVDPEDGAHRFPQDLESRLRHLSTFPTSPIHTSFVLLIFLSKKPG